MIHRIWIGQSGDKCKTTGSNLARSRGVEKRKQSRGSRETRAQVWKVREQREETLRRLKGQGSATKVGADQYDSRNPRWSLD